MRILYIILLLFAACIPTFAIQEDKKINLNDAINLALKTNPQMELARLDFEIAKNKIFSSSRLQNPNIHFFQNIPEAGNGNPQQIGVDYVVEILKRGKRKNTAKSYSVFAYDNQKFLEHALVLEVKKSYINLLLKKSNLKIIKEQEQISNDIYNSILKETKLKNMPETEAIQAKILLNRTIMYSNIARSEVVSAQNYFNSVLNTSDINYDTKEDSFPDDYTLLMAISPYEKVSNFEKIKNYAINNRYDLLAAKSEIETAKCELEVVKSARIPDIELTGGYAYQTKGMSEENRFTSGGYVGASIVNIPILYNFRPEIQNAEIEIKKAELKYEDAKTDAIRNITDAWEKYVISRDNLVFYNKELLSNSKELMEASKKSLDKKEIDLTTFLVSKKLYLEVILGYQEALYEYYTSYAALLKEINADSLNFNNEDI